MVGTLLSIGLFFGLYKVAMAHCPLCTIGAGVAATFAGWLGVEHISIGVLIGAFSVALGSWLSQMWDVKFRAKKETIILISFILTVVPIMPLFESYFSFFLNIGGEYGSLLNKTYIINRFLVGSIIGGVVMLISPWISKKITNIRKQSWGFQGLSITFGLLITITAIFELWLS